MSKKNLKLLTKKLAEAFIPQVWVKRRMCRNAEILYPIKLIRYGLCCELLKSEIVDSAKIAEIGIDRGQMKRWVRDAGYSQSFECWDGYDVKLKPELEQQGYTYLIQGDATAEDFKLRTDYDVALVIHFLEHLHEPELFLQKVDPFLKPGGCIIGGMPVTPEWFAKSREEKIRKTAKPFGHVSVFSPQRIERFAKNNGYVVEYQTGAFFARMSDKWIENSKLWLRFNLWFGRTFPSLGGEIYFKLRKLGD